MLLLLLFLFCLAVSGIIYWVAQRRPSAPFLLVASIIGSLFKENKVFMVGLTGAICLHLSGSVVLGGVKYNTSGFTIITHTMFGFFMRELIERVDRAKPFIGKIRGKLPVRARKLVTPSTIAFVCCGVNGLQEEIWDRMNPGMWPTRLTHVLDQLADVICDTTGIIISLNKKWFVQVSSRLHDRGSTAEVRESIKDSGDLE